MHDNPFKYGTVVTGDDFVDRRQELQIMTRELASGKSIVLFSQRRVGKTSLIMEFIRRKKNKFTTVFIDLYGMTSKEELAKQIVNAVIQASFTNLEKIHQVIKEYFSYLKPKLLISADGTVSLDIGIERSCQDEEFVEILDFPEKVAKKKKRKIVLILDEFQEIEMMNGKGIEKLMRSRFQHHKNVTYLFAGSKEHLLRQMFEEESRAFYKFARPLQLGLIPKPEFCSFVTNKFKNTGGKPAQNVIDKILEYTMGHPYFTQYLCHEIWYITRSPKKEYVIDAAIENIIAHQSIAYTHIWDELKSVNQRSLIIGIAAENGYNYSPDFIEKYKLKSQSHVEKSLRLLKNRGILDDEGKFVDIFLKEWIKRKIIINLMLD
jgi:AAA+ ATPase superfamily predicted ATPase